MTKKHKLFGYEIKVSDFSKNILTLVSGSTIAQIIPFAVTPILTRIYSPDDFGLLALYLGIANIVANIATGRYELAILLPKKTSESKSVVVLSIVISFILSFVALLIVLFFNTRIAELLGNKLLASWLYFIPLSIFLNGLYQSFYYWLNRHQKYKQMIYSKVIRTASTSILAVILQVFSMGLLYAQLLGRFVSTLYLLIYSRKRVTINFIEENNELRSVASKYKEFPIYDIPTALISSSTQNVPNILFNSYFSSVIGGYYYLAQRIIGLPISLISRAFIDVFKQQATDEYAKTGNARRAFKRIFIIMLLLSVIPFTLFYIFCEDVFAFAFGKEWYIAGVYAKILIPMVFFRFLAGPLSFMFYIANKQVYNLIGQFINLALLIAAFLIGSFYESEYVTLRFMSVSFSLFYIIYMIISYRLAINKNYLAP